MDNVLSLTVCTDTSTPYSTASVANCMITPYPTVPCGVKTESDNQKRLTYGKATGLFIGMFLAGVTVGIILTIFIYCLKRRSLARKYNTPRTHQVYVIVNCSWNTMTRMMPWIEHALCNQ